MKRYLLRTPAGTRWAMSLDALEQLLRHLPTGTRWEIVVDYPHGTYPLRSGVGPRL